MDEQQTILAAIKKTADEKSNTSPEIKKQIEDLENGIQEIRKHLNNADQTIDGIDMGFKNFRDVTVSWLKLHVIALGIAIYLAIYGLVAPSMNLAYDFSFTNLIMIAGIILFNLIAFFTFWSLHEDIMTMWEKTARNAESFIRQ